MLLIGGLIYLFGLFSRGAQRQLPTWFGKAVLNFAQRALEHRHERARRHLEREDERLNDMLAFTGRPE